MHNKYKVMAKDTCVLCAQQKKKQRGGSLASDNVLSIIPCDAYQNGGDDGVTTNATNVSNVDIDAFKNEYKVINRTGGKGGRYGSKRLPTKAVKKPRRVGDRLPKPHSGGSSNECSEVNNKADIFTEYIIGPATVPTSLPEASTSLPENIPGQVMSILAADTITLDNMFNDVVYPSYIHENSIPVTYSGLLR